MGYTILPQGHNRDHATALDFATWRDKARGMTPDSLRYVIKDCIDARDAMKGHNPDREGFYSDQASTYNDELRSRGLRL